MEAACWAHGRRNFFDLARINKAPIAVEAVEHIDVLFAIEREINGMPPQERVRMRHERSRPLVIELQTWLCAQRARVSKHSEIGKAIDHTLKRWGAFTRFLDDGQLCISNNDAERELRAVRHRAQELDLRWFRRGRPAGGRHLHLDRNRQAQQRRSASLARRRARPAKCIHELLPWNWHRAAA